MEFFEKYDYCNNDIIPNANLSHAGTKLYERVTFAVLKETSCCQLRECFSSGKTDHFEIYFEGEFLSKINDRKTALAIYKDFSA